MQIQAQTVSCCHPSIISRDGGQRVELDEQRADKTRLVGLESTLMSTFAGLEQKGLVLSDVNKDWTCKDKDKDQAYKDKDLNLVLKESLRTRINITACT